MVVVDRKEDLLRRLAERIRTCETAAATAPGGGGMPASVPSGWDPSLRLARSAVHEWSSAEHASDSAGDEASDRDDGDVRNDRPAAMFPLHYLAAPLLAFIHLSRVAVAQRPRRLVLWVGRRAWPHPHALMERSRCRDLDHDREQDRDRERGRGRVLSSHADLLSRSLFIDAPDAAARLWAIDVALRSRATNVIVADSSGFDVSQMRRLQLAAESGDALTLLSRPQREMASRSAGRYSGGRSGGGSGGAARWIVTPVVSQCASPRMVIELVRCKGPQRAVMATDAASPSTCSRAGFMQRRWLLEWDRHAQSLVRVPADVADRPHQSHQKKKQRAVFPLRFAG